MFPFSTRRPGAGAGDFALRLWDMEIVRDFPETRRKVP
jgi:hypothetical protein